MRNVTDALVAWAGMAAMVLICGCHVCCAKNQGDSTMIAGTESARGPMKSEASHVRWSLDHQINGAESEVNKGCHRLSEPSVHERKAGDVVTDLTDARDVTPGRKLIALASVSEFVHLSVKGFGDVVVSLPLGATTPRPIVIAAHGNYDTPQWQCEVWRNIVQNEAFVVCPRGSTRSDSPSRSDIRYHYLSRQHLQNEVDACVDALKQAYGQYVDSGPIIFTGFSQGAIMGAAIMIRDPSRYPRGVLIEGGDREWTRENIKKFAEHGGQRVLFACGQSDCSTRAKRVVGALEKQQIAAQVVYGSKQGHTYDGAVAEEVAKAFEWVVQGDDRWKLADDGP